MDQKLKFDFGITQMLIQKIAQLDQFKGAKN
jgi:hypothetical protein